MSCHGWLCPRCAPIQRGRLMRAINRAGAEHRLRYFWTLTCPAGTTRRDLQAGWHRYLAACQAAGYMRRWLWVREVHPGDGPAHGQLHVHLLTDRWIPWPWVRAAWQRATGGIHVYVRYVQGGRHGWYMSKYMVKTEVWVMPDRARRYGHSQDVPLSLRRVSEEPGRWVLRRCGISHPCVLTFGAERITLPAGSVIASSTKCVGPP